MKKLLLLLFVLPAISWAAPIDQNLAQQVAQNFIASSDENLNAQTATQPHRLKCVAKQATATPPYYIFNNEDGGFVIVSGDDCATPILGYSTEGSINLDNLPIQLQGLLHAYSCEIQEAVDNHLHATDEVAESWAAYKRAPQAQNTTAVVSPLISTSWNQYPRYNDKCPSDPSLSSLGGHPTTGCVATAMAQIMKYWGYPQKGTGNKSYHSEHYGTLSANFGITTYDWDNMPLKLTSSTSSTQNNAVASLMYHCGVAVSMGYNCDGRGSSGAQVIDLGSGRASAETALKTYFGYASTLAGKRWTSTISTATWKSMLKTELDNQRPILYAGFSSQGGHAFICDGYDNNDKFHFNWGWGGSSNGFYSLTAGTSGSHEYTEGQQAVIGIKPANGAGPAKSYDLFMKTDLTAINTSSSSSSTEVNPYYFGKGISFIAKVENNGTGIFNGSLRVAVFTYEGEFVAWSKESYHFSLGAGEYTVQKTYSFDGGIPFIHGKYRAYMYYQDDDETDWKLVKTDEGVIFTEYNNVVFTVKPLNSDSDIIPVSSFSVERGDFTVGSTTRIEVDVKNTALISAFYGKIRLCLYNPDGTRAQIIDELDYSNGFSANTTHTLSFTGVIDVEPGTYYMALITKQSDQTSWYFMGCRSTYLNPIIVAIKAPTLLSDYFEVNNTQAKATTLIWEIDEEMQDFSTYQVSLHEDADIDYYKLSFPNEGKYKVAVSLYDKYHKGSQWYENADAQFAYSIGGTTYSEYLQDEQIITFDAPTTLYIRVKPYGMSGLGYYELAGDIAETTPRNDCKTVPYAESFANSQGNFTVYNAVLPSGFTSIWNWDSRYGMVAKCIKGSTKYASESYLISPCIEIPMESQTVLSFQHAAKFFQNTSQMTLLISTDYNATNPSSAHWSELPIPQYPTGSDWTWYDSGLINLSGYRGQYINIAFHYTSNTSYAPQWEIKDFSVQEYTTPVENIQSDQSIASKIIRNGQLFILRGNMTYTVQGQEVR